VEDGYYFYKQVCRAGQPGMAVVRTITDDSDIAIIGFSSNNTKNPDSFVVINLSEQEKYINIEIIGSKSNYFLAYRTSNMEKYSYIGKFPIYNNAINYQTPPRSVTTFFGGLD
jgi:hypothetical protein